MGQRWQQRRRGWGASSSTATGTRTLDDGDLVAALVPGGDGAVDALDALYERHAPVVFGFLQERLGATERAEWALVETFERLWTHASVAPRDRAVLVRWLLLHARLLAAAAGAEARWSGATGDATSQGGAEKRLEDILITAELTRRSGRPPDVRAENDAFFRITRQLAAGAAGAAVLQTLMETATELCEAGTAGLSLLEAAPEGGDPVFRWTHMAGALAGAVGGTTPRNFSPCGVTLDRGAPQLFAYPARYFDYFAATPAPIVEGLVIPFSTSAGAEHDGTIWIVSHDESARPFDWEDARIMTSLASFTALALQVAERTSGEGLNVRAA